MSEQTPLHAEHEALGAAMVPFAGWEMPLRYSSDLAEHRAVREAAGLFDLSHMGELYVRGPQAAEALDRALVSDLSAVAVGRAKYTMICAEDGGVIDDLVVYRLAEDQFLIVANAANATIVLTELEQRCAGLEVTLRTADLALVAPQGPRAAAVVAGLTPLDLGGLRNYRWAETTLAERPVLLARTGYTGEDGFEVFCSPEDAVAIWRALLAAGEPAGLIPCGLASRDSLRLEAGMPLYGHELSRQVTPYEAGLGRVVALDKESFVGRQALATRAQEGPRQRLVGLRVQGRRAAREGYPVCDNDSEQVGTVTSGAPSPTLGYPIAMAYVPVELSAPGTQVSVRIRAAQASAEVVSLPFYRCGTGS